MSGGVDSSVAAWLLRRAGHEVIGVFLRLGPEAGASGAGRNPAARHRGCCGVEDSRDAALVAARIGIPYYSMNYEGQFARIIDHFVDEYNSGRTPIPCILCNQWLKFGSLRERARALGCDYVATGHYARVERAGDGGPWQLRRGRDEDKDQSYFLFLMPPESLEHTLFPLGDSTKEEVRALARAADLPVAEKPESQEICFVPGGDYRELVRARTPERFREGAFIDLSGNVLGRHGGHQNFTIGQRRGVGLAFGTPRYVVGIDPATNTVTLAEREALARRVVHVDGIQWTSLAEPPPCGRPLRVDAQIRYRHRPQAAEVVPQSPTRAVLSFVTPQEAVTPGQAAVFYDGDVVLGGGWIESAEG
jgi:tRNA-specific 2-thiouridylase